MRAGTLNRVAFRSARGRQDTVAVAYPGLSAAPRSGQTAPESCLREARPHYLPLLCGERCGPCPIERLRQPREYHEVGVESDALQATDTQRGEAVVVLQVSERALDSGAATVEVAESLRVARDAREQPAAKGERQRWLI